MMRLVSVNVEALDPEAAMNAARARIEATNGHERFEIVECWAEINDAEWSDSPIGLRWRVYLRIAERAVPR